MSNQGHWVGLKADTKNFFGFIYLITDTETNRKYIGKKQFFFAKPRAKGCRSKVADRQSPKWKGCCWKDSGWRDYKGSSPSLAKWMKANPDNIYTYEIIQLCRSRGLLTYTEVAEMWERKVLETKLPDGEYEYFNRHIGAIKFRPQVFEEGT